MTTNSEYFRPTSYSIHDETDGHSFNITAEYATKPAPGMIRLIGATEIIVAKVNTRIANGHVLRVHIIGAESYRLVSVEPVHRRAVVNGFAPATFAAIMRMRDKNKATGTDGVTP